MKAHTFLPALALTSAACLSGCVIAEPPRVVTVRETVVPPPPPPGAVVYNPGYTVTTLNPGYRTMRYKRQTYYVDRDTYYRRTPRGYVVVQRPW